MTDRVPPPRPLAPRRRLSIGTALAAVVVAVAGLAALLTPLLLPGATDQDVLLGVRPPGDGHLLGTDELGRDVLQLLAAGATTAVLGALAVAVGAMAVGLLLGVPAGFLGGWVDQVAMRWTDLMFSLPALLVAVVVAGVLGGGFVLAVLVLVVLFSPGDTRVSRAAAMEQAHRPYVEATRVMGLPTRTVLTRHVLPNVLPMALANAFLNFGFALVSLASLSFLGLGVGPGSPDWGRTLSDSRTLLFDNPWAAVAPGLAIIVTAAAVNILGDRLAARTEDA